MPNAVTTIWTLTLREVKRIARSHSLLLTLLVAPLVYAFFYGSIYANKEEEDVKLAVVDDDQSSVSRLITQQIGNAQVVHLIAMPTIQDAQESMFRGECQGFLYIEKGLERKIKSLSQADIVVALNAARFLPSSDLLMSINQTCLTVGAGVRLQYLQKSQGLSTELSNMEVMPVNIDYRPLYNSRSSYGAFLLPGLLALILQQILLIGMSASVSEERGEGTAAVWLKEARGSLSMALWGKGFFYILLFGCYAFFFLRVNYSILNIPMRGNGFQLSMLVGLFILTLIPMGVWIGSLFRNSLLNTQVMAFSTYPFFLISGYTFPLQNVPKALSVLAHLLPTTPFLAAYTSIVQTGGSLKQNLPSLLNLIGLFFFYTLLALYGIRKIKRLSMIIAISAITLTASAQEQKDETSLTQKDTVSNFSAYGRSVTLSGLLQTRYVASMEKDVDVNGLNFNPDSTKGITNTFLIKRVRVMLKANVNDHWSANILVNFAEFNQSPQGKVLENAYIKYHLNKYFNVVAGQFRPYFGIEDAVSVDIIRTLDFSNQYYGFGRNGWQSFQVGLSVLGSVTKDERLRYFAGVYNGNGRNTATDNNNTKNFYGRLEGDPLKNVTVAFNAASGNTGGQGIGNAWGGDATAKIPMSQKWFLLLMGEYKSGTNFTAFDTNTVVHDAGLNQFRMHGFYFFPTFRYEYKKPRVRAIEFSCRYEYFDENYKVASNLRQTLIPNVSFIFADNFYAALQVGMAIDWYKHDIPLSTFYDHNLAYAQLQIRL